MSTVADAVAGETLRDMGYLGSLSVLRLWQEGLRVPSEIASIPNESARRSWLNFRTGFAGGINNEDMRPNLTGRPADLRIINGNAGNRMLYRITRGPVSTPWSADADVLVPEAVVDTRRGRLLGRNLPPGAVLEYRHISSGAGSMYGVLLDWEPPAGDPPPPLPPVILPGSVRVILAYDVARVSAGPFAVIAAAFAGPVGLGFALLEFVNGRLFGAPFALPDGSQDLTTGRWIVTGLPWWGAAEVAARSGRWVRRAGWFSRQIRFEAGAGAAPAVAVVRDGSVVTPLDFAAEEFAATDWEIPEASSPQRLDITEFVFSPTANPFVVVASPSASSSSPQSAPPGVSLQDITLPVTSEGFLYVRAGRATLVPARRASTLEVWRPA